MTSFLDKRTGGGEGKGKAKKSTLRRARALSETKSWYADRHQSVMVQRNALFIVALVLMAGLGLCVMMVASMTNSKTFEPFVVEVEDKSGLITQVSTQAKEQYTQEEALLRSMLAQYIKAREGYDVETYRYNYSYPVRLMSSPDVYTGFRTLFSASNKDSPVNFGRNKRREVVIKSLTFLDNTKKKAQIRLQLNDLALPGLAPAGKQDVVILITFDFKNLDLTPEERYINPLGFQIQSYLAEKEFVDEKQE
jgi:type IV secretion system protein VirB8